MKISRGAKITAFVLLLLIIDQVSKILVKCNMTIGQSIHVFGDWFQIFFIENNGMAFGMQAGGSVGKLILSICRIVLVIAVFLYIRKLMKKPDVPVGVLFGLAAIMCGALGNILDSLFYGVIFSESTFTDVAQLFPQGGGYSKFLFGKVVDMLYFPIVDTTLPSWVPIWGGKDILFFRPIFNFADTCITCGAFYLAIFHWKYFSKAVPKN
ncbi:MAG: lipoprotein signal peptidase [Bacteroidales bacterium]|nr:lipoprotein signal peptidase [Bacteroidales bacterium]MDD3201732.1 lipoprotein signal peptidase [Bacteroidales bacterium]